MRSRPAIIARAVMAEAIERAGHDQAFEDALADDLRIDALAEILEAGERPFAALRDDVLDRRVADALDGRQRIEDAVVADLEVAERGHDRGRARRRCRDACASCRKSASLSVFDMSSVIDAARNSTG